MKLAADGVVDPPLRHLEAHVGDGSRLVALQRLQIRPDQERLPLQRVEALRRPIATQVSGSLDGAVVGAAEEGAQAVRRHRQF